MRKKRRKTQKARQANGLESWVEWQEHQYVPGYYTGGRIPPYLLGRRPNRYGCLLVVMGILILVGGVAFGLGGPDDEGTMGFVIYVFWGMLGILHLLAGIKLLRRKTRD